jgi:hypothetical protein
MDRIISSDDGAAFDTIALTAIDRLISMITEAIYASDDARALALDRVLQDVEGLAEIGGCRFSVHETQRPLIDSAVSDPGGCG